MSGMSSMDRLACRILPALLVGLLAGCGAVAARLPLPWMLGPLFAIALSRIAGLPFEPVRGSRQAGQWAIGAAIGLGFTPAVVAELARHGLMILSIALSSVLFGLLAARAIQRWGRVSAPTALFAGLPGGASEMVVLAQGAGGASDRVAAAHALRVMLVVSLVPFALQHGAAHYPPQILAAATDWSRFPLLLGASLAGTMLFRLCRLPNGWILGPLLGVGVLTMAGVELAQLPAWLVNGGQMLLGIALGCRFSPEFFRAAPRFLAVSAIATVLILLSSGLFVVSLAWLARDSAASLLLAAAPGGMAEMSITARELGLGVPFVTATHVVRVVLLTLVAPMLCGRYLAWVGGR